MFRGFGSINLYITPAMGRILVGYKFNKFYQIPLQIKTDSTLSTLFSYFPPWIPSQRWQKGSIAYYAAVVLYAECGKYRYRVYGWRQCCTYR